MRWEIGRVFLDVACDLGDLVGNLVRSREGGRVDDSVHCKAQLYDGRCFIDKVRGDGRSIKIVGFEGVDDGVPNYC